MENNDTNKFLSDEDNLIKKLHKIVKNTIKEEKLIIDNLSHPPVEMLTRGQKISDKVARFGGSWNFIIIFILILFIWIGFNVIAIHYRFDPFPFILMNLILSCIAALQAPVIMMSQNRQEEKDRKRSENDYLINLKAEIELRGLHDKIDLFLEHHIKVLYNSHAEQLKILNEIQQQLMKK